MVGVAGIGQCVGAYNRKVSSLGISIVAKVTYIPQFFLNFTFWSTWFTGWVFGTLLADLIVDSSGAATDMDGQEVAVTIL